MISTLASATLLTLSVSLLPASAQPPVMQADAGPNEVVNPQITDAVTETDAEALGDAPAEAAHNATSAEQNSNTVLQATTTQGVSLDIANEVSLDPDSPD